MSELPERKAISNRQQTSSRERDAVRRKSGESVSHSDPGLMEPSIPPTADRKLAARVSEGQGASLRPASHQPKNGWGLGQSPIRAAGTVPLTSLDKERLIATEPPGTQRLFSANPQEQAILQRKVDDVLRSRRKGCGRWSMCGAWRSGKRRIQRLNCKCWGCGRCGPKRAKRTRRAIVQLARENNLKNFLTLTLDPDKLDGVESTRYIKKCLHKLLTIIRRKHGNAITYICVLEYQRNGNAHLHILLDRYIEWEWVKARWVAVGGGPMVWIKYVDVDRIGNYISKYFSKELLTSPAPRGFRKVTTSRSIKLFPKVASDVAWTLMKVAIERIRLQFSNVNDESFDEEGLLEVFVVSAGGLPDEGRT
jgi:hypothetical protein